MPPQRQRCDTVAVIPAGGRRIQGPAAGRGGQAGQAGRQWRSQRGHLLGGGAGRPATRPAAGSSGPEPGTIINHAPQGRERPPRAHGPHRHNGRASPVPHGDPGLPRQLPYDTTATGHHAGPAARDRRTPPGRRPLTINEIAPPPIHGPSGRTGYQDLRGHTLGAILRLASSHRLFR